MTDNDQAQIEGIVAEMVEARDRMAARPDIELDLMDESPRTFARRVIDRVDELRETLADSRVLRPEIEGRVLAVLEEYGASVTSVLCVRLGWERAPTWDALGRLRAAGAAIALPATEPRGEQAFEAVEGWSGLQDGASG